MTVRDAGGLVLGVANYALFWAVGFAIGVYDAARARKQFKISGWDY